jgi:hypothetical protein
MPKASRRKQTTTFQKKNVTGECWNVFSKMMIPLMKIFLEMIWTWLFKDV